MFRFLALLAVVSVGFTVWCLVEAISADEARVRKLPKLAWILLILLVPFVGSIAWLRAGRPSAAVERAASAAERAAAAADFAEFERPGRLDQSEPADDEAYRKLLRERAEEQRRRYEQQRKDKPEADKPEADKPEADKPEADKPEADK